MIGRTNCTQKSGSPSEFVNIQMLTNQAEHSNLNGAVLTMSYETYSKQYTWDGKEITFSVPAHVSCTIEFPSVEGYKKPDNITFIAVEGNSRTIEAEYKAELVKVNVTSSNGSAVNGATLTINGKQQIWNGTEIRQLVPFGTQYSVVAGAVSGFGTPSTQTFTAQNPEREVSVVYIASSLKVNILSNQGTDAAIANVKATVKYGSTSVEVANGGTVNLPMNTSVTISFPEVVDYKKPADITYTHTGGLVEKSGTYQCELLTVNVSADNGSVSGFEVTISKRETVGVSTKYTKLEYIESTGTQYIDTGFKPNQDTRVVMDFENKGNYSGMTTGLCPLLGARNGSSSAVYALWVGATSYPHYGNVAYNKNGSFSIDINTRLIYDFNKNVVSIGDTSITCSTSTFSTNYNLCLLTIDNYGTIESRKASGKLYSCKVYDNGVLIRDYIPVKDSNGAAGLYDVVNDAFYASSGSEGFIAGGEISEVIGVQTSASGNYKIPFGESYNIEASDIDGFETPEPVSRVASEKEFVATMEYKAVGVKDLSLMDVYGNKIQRSTANCYVVREAGQYKFPLVFGNAIKNGKVNTAAFTNNGGANSHDFVYGTPYTSYESDVITQPYINPYFALSSSDVQIETSDVDGAITDLGLEDGDECKFVTFKVANVPTTGGNVIITLNTTYGDYWSWHIWLWPHDLSPVEITNATGVKYKIMPVNLASKYDSDGVHIKNWFYQWGRPNPMLCPNAWNSTTDHSPGSITKTSKADTLKIGIMNPSKFYYNSSSPNNWFGTKSYYNLWDAACTGTGNSDNDTVKTVYDPCPVGWKVPNGNTFTGLSVLSSGNGIAKMRRYSGDTVGVVFPVSGIRLHSNGSLDGVGSYGFVWLSSASSQSYAYCLFFYLSSVSPQGSRGRSLGYSVRPVQDDNIQLDVIMISFTIYHRDGRTTSHQAESGMTWFEWVHSDYNTAGAAIDSSNWYVRVDSLTVKEPNELASVRGSDNIVGGETYIL